MRVRLLVPTLSLSVIVMLVAATIGASSVVRHLNKRFVQQAEHTVEMIANVGVPYITNYDLTALGSFVTEMLRDEQVVFAEFFDADGKSLTSDVAQAPADVSNLLLVEHEMKDTSGQTVGTLKAGYRDVGAAVARNLVLSAIGGGMLAVLMVVAALLLWATRQVMKTIGTEPAQAVALADSIASGDLTQDAAFATSDSTSLMSALVRMQIQLRSIVEGIREAAASIHTSCAEIAHGHVDLSNRTEEEAASLQETAASMEEMTATVSRNADNAKMASRHAAEASDVAARGGQAVAEVVSTMSDISASSAKIADIIGVIDGIAFQTNLLALNAAVEAARAGEQGRGFAVVASEVRSLAQRSATAAKEIRQLISESVERIDAGSKQVTAAGTTMGEIVESVKRVSALIEDISAASQEQSQSIMQVSATVQQLDKVTQRNATLVGEVTTSSTSLGEQAEFLTQAVGSFKLAETKGSGRASAASAEAASRTPPQHRNAQPTPMPAPKSPVVKVAHEQQPEPSMSAADGTRWQEF
jgi:methyl-accepting chemotaxis protein